MIPDDRLPDLEDGVLPWQKAGYLSQLEEDEKIIVNKVYDVTTDLDTIPGEGLNSKIQHVIDNKLVNDTIMFYFPPGEYVFTTTLGITQDSIKNGSNLIFKGAGSEHTTLKFVHVWYMTPDGLSRFYDFITITGESNNPIHNVGIEDLKIDRDDYYNVVGSLTEVYEGMSIRYKYAQNCWVSGVEFDNAARNHIYIEHSNNLEFRGCYFHHAFSYGGGGRGYGIQIGKYSNKCLVENNVFGKLRHAIVLSDEAHHNVIGYNAADDQHAGYPFPIGYFDWVTPDMCIHGHNDGFPGGGPYENLFEGNYCSFVRIDDAHGSNGPRNTIFRNRADEVGFEVCSGSNEQNIVNNYFKCGNTALCIGYGVPWKCNSNNNLKENNKCKENNLSGWHVFWEEDEDPTYYDDYSYYYESKPDFIPESSWPFDPVNQTIPAEERRDSSGIKTILAGWDYYYHTYSPLEISGEVLDESGTGIPNVEMQFSGIPNVFTNSNGYYMKYVWYGWSGTVTPWKDVSWEFSPPYRTYENVCSDQEDQHYTGTRTQGIQGYITLSGGSSNVEDVKVTAGGETVNPNSDGFYSIILPPGTYDVTASLVAYHPATIHDVQVEEYAAIIVDLTLNHHGNIIVNQDGTGDFTTIQAGIDAAHDGETVRVMDGVYTGENNINLHWSGKHITVRSHSGPDNCIIDGFDRGYARGFYLADPEINNSDLIYGFTIRNFRTGPYSGPYGTTKNGAGICCINGASPTIQNCIIEDCFMDSDYDLENPVPKTGFGIGIYCEGSTVIRNCIIQGNEGWDIEGGAGIACKGNVLIEGCTIRNNLLNACYGIGGGPVGDIFLQGAGICACSDDNGSPTIKNNTIYNNYREGPGLAGYSHGVAIFAYAESSTNLMPVKILNNTIYNNPSKGVFSYSGDAICIFPAYTMPIEICGNLIYDNNTNGVGNHCHWSPFTFENNTVMNNHGHGLYINDGPEICIRNNVIAFNDGYGIRWNTGTEGLTVEYSVIYGNEAGDYDLEPEEGPNTFHVDPQIDTVNVYQPIWNSQNFSPCIDTGDPQTEWDTDGTPPDMGAIPAIPHDYFYNQWDGGVVDRIEWISFPALNRITQGYTEALGLLERQGLIDDDDEFEDDILDHVVYEYINRIYFDNGWQNNLPPDGDFHSYQGYKVVLQQGYDSVPIGISGMWEDESKPIQLYADKQNWVGCYLKEPATLQDAFESIWDEWISIQSEHWAICRPWDEEIIIKGTVNPGELYIIRVANDCELVWNESSPPVDPYIREMTDYFSYEEKLDYMPILVDTVYGDTTVAEIGVFCEDECIGASKVTDGYPVQLLAYTPEGDGELEFMLYYGDDGLKGPSQSMADYRVYDSQISAYLEKPVYYDRDSYVKVELNTSGAPKHDLPFGLFGNYPNPAYGGITNISFAPVKDAANTEIQIFNIKGQLVRTIDCAPAIAQGSKDGIYSVTWDCKDNYGKKVGTGIYFYKLTSGEKKAVKKMLILH
jgi:hypothetical protein